MQQCHRLIVSNLDEGNSNMEMTGLLFLITACKAWYVLVSTEDYTATFCLVSSATFETMNRVTADCESLIRHNKHESYDTNVAILEILTKLLLESQQKLATISSMLDKPNSLCQTKPYHTTGIIKKDWYAPLLAYFWIFITFHLLNASHGLLFILLYCNADICELYLAVGSA